MNNTKLKEKVKKSWDSFICYPKNEETKELRVGTHEFFEVMSKKRYEAHPYIFKLIDNSYCKGKKVLEIGCGIGTDLVNFARKGAIVSGIDLSPRSIELARKNFLLNKKKSKLLQADAENLPFNNDSFDVVYSMGVLHHTPNTQKSINEVYRVLKKNGKLIVMLYHKNFFTYWIKLFFIRGILKLGLLKKTLEDIRNELEYDNCPLTKLYTRSEAVKMFSEAGFKNINTELFYMHQRNVPILGSIIPQNILDIFAKKYGFHLVIYAEK